MKLGLLSFALLGIILTPQMFVQAATTAARLEGRILLQAQQHGEAWYVSNGVRYYLADGDSAYSLMRLHSLGINDKDLAQIPAVTDANAMLTATSICGSNASAKRQSGKILLQVQQHGEAWYVHPDKCRRVYMKDGSAAYSIMRLLSLGITEVDLQKIPSIAILPTDHVRGNANAEAFIIEYCDFQSPFCVNFAKTLKTLQDENPGRLTLIYRQFPLKEIFPMAEKSAEASECASEQGKFWEMHDALYELSEQGGLSISAFQDKAVSLGLDTKKFNSCLDSGKYASRIQDDYNRGIKDKVMGVPDSLLGAEEIPGAIPIEEMRMRLGKVLQ